MILGDLVLTDLRKASCGFVLGQSVLASLKVSKRYFNIILCLLNNTD